MKKFGVFSGFLGSGKTTSLMALSKYFSEHYAKASMISNDLGGPNLADNRLAQLTGCTASELTGTCICYQTENLVARLNKLFNEDGCELVLSDIPGFGVGALDHVYHKLNENYPGQFPLAPFTVLCEPQTVRNLIENDGGDLAYIFKSQLREADLIVLNKCDLLNKDEKASMISWLKRGYPKSGVIGISALTGEGLKELSEYLIDKSASLEKPDLAYGGEEFLSAMGKFSEFNIQYYAVVCCESFDGNAYLKKIAESIQKEISDLKDSEIPHLKLLAWEPEGDYAKLDVLGSGRKIETVKEFSRPWTELAVIFNTSAVCGKAELDRIMSSCIERVSEEFQLSIMIYKKECFSALGDD